MSTSLCLVRKWGTSDETIFGSIFLDLILHSFINKIRNIDISQYKGYFSSKPVLGTEIKNFRRDHIWLKCVWFYTCFMNKIWNIDISEYKSYFSTQVSPRYRNKELPTRPYLDNTCCISICLILQSFMNKIWNIDISQYKGYFSTQVSPRYGNNELLTRPYLVAFICEFNFTVLWLKSKTFISPSTRAILVSQYMCPRAVLWGHF